jgi:hypothetical protein
MLTIFAITTALITIPITTAITFAFKATITATLF